jgi:hypothetical protein
MGANKFYNLDICLKMHGGVRKQNISSSALNLSAKREKTGNRFFKLNNV